MKYRIRKIFTHDRPAGVFAEKVCPTGLMLQLWMKGESVEVLQLNEVEFEEEKLEVFLLPRSSRTLGLRFL